VPSEHKRIHRKGSEYTLEIRWRAKPLKRSGLVIAPGQVLTIPVGTSSVCIQNNGFFTYAHVIVRRGIGTSYV